MGKTRWWDRWHVRTSTLASVTLVLILWYILSPTRFRDAGATVEHVAALIAAITAAFSATGDVIKFARGKQVPEAEQTSHTQPAIRPVGSARAPRRDSYFKPTTAGSAKRAGTNAGS